jgi:hypothetical protein
MAETMRRLMPDLAQTLPLYPFGYEHRKVWEYAHVLLGLDRIGALRPDAFVLSIGAGHEEPLTNRVRWVFAHGYLWPRKLHGGRRAVEYRFGGFRPFL